MNAGATSQRVYEALKQRLLAGTDPPDTRLEPALLAEELASSVTPVRDALHRLVGERLVESRPRDGFHLPHVTEPLLRDLYAWNASLVRLSVAAWHGGEDARPRIDIEARPGRLARACFDILAARSTNAEHAWQVAATSDRLSAARHAEERSLAGIGTETESLARLCTGNDRREIVRASNAYHRRRIGAASTILRAIYAPGP